MRTKVELVKLAILLGRIAVGSWEAWDLVEFPPGHVLDRLGIDDVGTIIERTEAQLLGVANFRTDSQLKEVKDPRPRPASRQLAYCKLSEEPFDFLAQIVPSMGIRLNPAEFKIGRLHGSALVNRTGAVPEQSTTRFFENCDEVLFVRDADKMKYVGSVGINIAVPCSYAVLRTACWEAASER